MKEPSTFLLDPTDSTPFVEFDYRYGRLDIIGRQAPRANPDFYRQIRSRVEHYLAQSADVLNVNISFENPEVSTNPEFLSFLKSMKSANQERMEIFLNWYYDECDPKTRHTLEAHMRDLGIRFLMRPYSA